ncbi:sugar ABC transporter ATP-binding protein [Poriferisphaera sp. WC338]|uniref:sugar ABC transporter ATP-binding protein n=1 Tax=Poriferisphaera sp. WC338 TaxID=3425129 RepID=UPI003D8174E1
MIDGAEKTGEELRLKVKGAYKRFGATVALDGVDLDLRVGEVHAVIGENGAGKSTLMKALSGAHELDEGEIWLDGEVYRPANPNEGRRAGVSMIYQELSLAQHLSVMENITLGVEPTRRGLMRWGEVKRIARDALAEVGKGELPLKKVVRELSNAEKQLVEIARSVATGCRVLVLDEPTSSLSQKDTEQLFTLIRKMKSEGVSIIYISHFLEEVKAVCDRFTVLRDGASVGTGDVATTEQSEIVNMMVGRDVTEMYPRQVHERGELMLEVKGLKGEGGVPKGVNFELYRGEVVGIAGVIGAGRTEMLRSIFELDEVEEGEVKVGAYVGPASPSMRWLQGMGMVSEDRKFEGLAVGLPIADNVVMSQLEGLGPMGLVTRGGLSRACKPWVEKIPIKCASVFAKVDSLSGGNQQKVALARLLHSDADVMLLDEPTRGIDVGSKAQIYTMIDELARGAFGDAVGGGKPKAILIVSSYLPELLGICDRIGVMCRGELGPLREAKGLDEHQIMLEATGLGDSHAG